MIWIRSYLPLQPVPRRRVAAAVAKANETLSLTCARVEMPTRTDKWVYFWRGFFLHRVVARRVRNPLGLGGVWRFKVNTEYSSTWRQLFIVKPREFRYRPAVFSHLPPLVSRCQQSAHRSLCLIASLCFSFRSGWKHRQSGSKVSVFKKIQPTKHI